MFKVLAPIITSCLFTAFATLAAAQDSPTTTEPAATNADEVAKIQAAVESYVAAFNAKDARKLAEHFSPDGIYMSRTSGERISGRQAMTEAFAAMFDDEQSPKLAVHTESIDLISPSVARELGSAVVTRTDEDVVETTYTAIYVKYSGEWLIDRVTEEDVAAEASHAEQLQELQWLIGDWVDTGEGITIEMSCQWTRNQNFISRRYKISDQDLLDSSGLQIIGWDAASEQIRSWLFDSTGGFVTGTWTQSDGKWTVQSVATLADGSQGSFTSVFQPTEDGNYTWRKINRLLDGRILPNLNKVLVQRK